MLAGDFTLLLRSFANAQDDKLDDNLLIQEELWTAIEAEVLDATGEVDIACEYA